MATLITAGVPAEEFALSTTLETVPETAFKCETVVETGENIVMPLVWARASHFDALDSALQDDPTVSNVTVLSDFDGQRLYRMEWIDQTELLIHMIVNNEAILLDASTDNGQWVLRMLHLEQADTDEILSFCESHRLSLDIRSVREMEFEPAGRYGLTDEQYRSLLLAYKRGYFCVPRDATLDDLSEELGVSHQALSERLRRATDALIADTLAVDSLRPVDESNPPQSDSKL